MAKKIQKAGMFVIDTIPGLGLTATGAAVLHAIVRKTMSFGKLSEKLSLDFFLRGHCGGELCILPPCRVKGSFYNARLRLEKRRIVFRNVDVYTPNAFGILKVARAIWPSSKGLANAFKDIEHIFKKESKPLQALAIEKELLMDLDQAVSEGNKRFKQAKQKKKMSVAWVLPYFKEKVLEQGRSIVLEPITETELKKVKRCIRIWLGECEKKEVDPKEHLDMVCLYWPSICEAGLVHHQSGHLLPLKWDQTSWQQYFTYRIEIDAWLENPPEEPPKNTSEEMWL